jgi:hypothetical protein
MPTLVDAYFCLLATGSLVRRWLLNGQPIKSKDRLPAATRGRYRKLWMDFNSIEARG